METSRGNVRGMVEKPTKIEALDAAAGVEPVGNEQASRGCGRGVPLKEPS